MKFIIISFNISPLYAAIENDNAEIVQLLLSCENIDVNFENVLK